MDGGLPSIWRTELLHPVAVHFPIVLLTAGTLAWFAGQLPRRTEYLPSLSFLLPAGRLSLFVGTVTAWIAIYTGSLADAEVVRSLCDPTVVEEHENLAFLTGYLFSISVVVDLASNSISFFRRWNHFLAPLVGLLLITGSVTLTYVGHLGAKLVYQQGAGVYHPSDTCTEFE
jgi:uncharacterized membrane protein